MGEVNVLIVEDDVRLADVVRRGLVDAAHDVTLAHTGAAALAAAGTERFDVIVLDWMLPEGDGPSVCRALRDRGDHTPVLMLTARHAVADRVDGLDAGADDYLTKPFSLDELLARLRALGRRQGPAEIIAVGDLVLDRNRRSVTRGGVLIDLTAREFDLLFLLASRAGHVVTRLDILDEVWDGETDLRSNAIDVHIAKLRAKIDRPFGTASIETLRTAGYRLRDGRA
jgi:DNA-binding response OmpR family regulator